MTYEDSLLKKTRCGKRRSIAHGGGWAGAGCVANEKCPQRSHPVAKRGRQGWGHPWNCIVLGASGGTPPLPPVIFIFNKLRLKSAQNITNKRLTGKVSQNKDLAEKMTGGRDSLRWEVGKSGRGVGVCMRSRWRGTQIPSSSWGVILGGRQGWG